MPKLLITGEKYKPFKGTYYRVAPGRLASEQLVFDHILKDLDTNKDVYGLPAGQLQDFIFLAEIHGFKVQTSK